MCVEDNSSGAEAKDAIVIKVLPYLVVACLLTGVINVIFRGTEGTLGMILVRLCEPFVVGFMLLGVYAVIKRAAPVTTSKIPILCMIVGPVVVAACAFMIGEYLIPGIFGSALFERTDNIIVDILLCSGKLYLILIMVMLVVHGVEAVVSSHFKTYISRVYRYMETLKNDGTDGRKGELTLKMYDVPEIIDIERVEMEPIERKGFPLDDCISMAVSIFALGLIICSYIFLNPVFMQNMTIYETMMIGIIISFFIPVLIMPWYITKETGTKIKSQAPRDLYLWKGLRKRMYQSFFAFTMILFLIILTLYLVKDLSRVTYTYLGYVTFLMFTSIIYAYMFFNYYNVELKEGIIKRFEESDQRSLK